MVIAIFAGMQFGLPGCKKENNNSDQNYYFKATFDGVSYLQNITATNGYAATSNITSPDAVNGASITGGIGPTDIYATTTAMYFTRASANNYSSSTIDQFNAYFAPGIYTYTTSPDRASGKTFSVGFRDNSGQWWETFAGSADQTNSKIQIISIANADSTSNYYIKVKILFSCNLYNETTGEEKTLTNGEFYGVFGKL